MRGVAIRAGIAAAVVIAAFAITVGVLNSTLFSATGFVREYLDANCTTPVTLEDLSRIAGLSPYHLNRLFCAEVGIAPHTYQLHRRIEKSKALLLSGMPIADAALESGFSDQSHFSKFFRKITGTTPGHFAACNASEKEKS